MIPCQNHEKHENLIIPFQNYENYEILEIPYYNHKEYEKIINSMPELRKS